MSQLTSPDHFADCVSQVLQPDQETWLACNESLYPVPTHLLWLPVSMWSCWHFPPQHSVRGSLLPPSPRPCPVPGAAHFLSQIQGLPKFFLMIRFTSTLLETWLWVQKARKLLRDRAQERKWSLPRTNNLPFSWVLTLTCPIAHWFC